MTVKGHKTGKSRSEQMTSVCPSKADVRAADPMSTGLDALNACSSCLRIARQRRALTPLARAMPGHDVGNALFAMRLA
jgi:hypothetical protein